VREGSKVSQVSTESSSSKDMDSGASAALPQSDSHIQSALLPNSLIAIGVFMLMGLIFFLGTKFARRSSGGGSSATSKKGANGHSSDNDEAMTIEDQQKELNELRRRLRILEQQMQQSDGKKKKN
jgi:hypothetical protein